MDQSEINSIREVMKTITGTLIATSSFYYQSVPLGREEVPHEVYHPHVAMGVAADGSAIPLAHEEELGGCVDIGRMIKAANILAENAAGRLRALNIEVIAVIHESWVVEKQITGNEIPADVLNGPSPENHPDRKEVLSIYLVSVRGGIKATTLLLIERPTGLRPTLREWKPITFYDLRHPQPGDLSFITTEGDIKRPPDSPLH